MAEVEFRDGKKNIADHLAEMMRGLPTHTMTLDEATRAANNTLVSAKFSEARQRLITQHFKDHPE